MGNEVKLDYCKNELLQATLVVKHHVSAEKLHLMTNLFFGGKVPPPKIFKGTDIAQMIKNADCYTQHVDLTPDFSKLDTNQDIPFNITAEPTQVSYSIAYFKGILLTLRPYEFRFTKAIGDQKPTVAIEAYYGHGQVYNGDVSDAIP